MVLFSKFWNKLKLINSIKQVDIFTKLFHFIVLGTPCYKPKILCHMLNVYFTKSFEVLAPGEQFNILNATRLFT